MGSRQAAPITQHPSQQLTLPAEATVVRGAAHDAGISVQEGAVLVAALTCRSKEQDNAQSNTMEITQGWAGWRNRDAPGAPRLWGISPRRQEVASSTCWRPGLRDSGAGEGEAPAPTERGAETALGHPALVTLVQEAAAVALGAEPAHQGPHPTSGLEGAAHTGPPHAPSVTPPCAPQHPLLPCLHPGSPILRLLAWSTQGGAFPWGGDVQHPLGAQGLVHKELTRSGCPGEARALPSAKGVGAPIPRAGRMMGSEQC